MPATCFEFVHFIEGTSRVCVEREDKGVCRGVKQTGELDWIGSVPAAPTNVIYLLNEVNAAPCRAVRAWKSRVDWLITLATMPIIWRFQTPHVQLRHYSYIESNNIHIWLVPVTHDTFTHYSNPSFSFILPWSIRSKAVAPSHVDSRPTIARDKSVSYNHRWRWRSAWWTGVIVTNPVKASQITSLYFMYPSLGMNEHLEP